VTRQLGLPQVDVVVTGGGTAGHVLPAIAVARAVVAAGHCADRIRFVGARRGMEAELVPAAGFEARLLPGRGVARRLSSANVAAIGGLAVALLEALVLLARWRPRALVTVGGYAGAPATFAAIVLRIPVVVVNVDAVPGVANRLAAPFAAACAVALPGTPLPRAVVTGVPLRPEVLAAREADRPVARSAARRALGLPGDAAVVAVTGGSLGARRLNDAALGLARLVDAAGVPPAGGEAELRAGRLAEGERAPRRPGGAVVVYHVSGRRDHERVAALSATGLHGNYRAVAFEEQMAQLLLACDLLVSRAGASTVAEVCALGVPSILVPLPGAPADHQRRNAEVLVRAGAAVMLDDAECTPERLAAAVADLLADPGRLASMRAAAAGLGRPDAAARVADLVEQAGRWR
jgi:UDP-N-acetylglucosamine--N-acetylmuramyl-(pentapeptide) pyrophosphoryl-undecaprenol N-acetylglucosamine transferase